MTRTVWTCTAGAMLNQAAELMALDGCGFIPVVGDADGATDLKGVVTDRDIVLAAYLENKPLSAIPPLPRCRPT